MGANQSANDPVQQVFGFAAASESRSGQNLDVSAVELDALRQSVLKLTEPELVVGADGQKKPKRQRSLFLERAEACPDAFTFDLTDERDRAAACAVLQLDSRVSSIKPELVPQLVTERQFFFNYFSHVMVLHVNSVAALLTEQRQQQTPVAPAPPATGPSAPAQKTPLPTNPPPAPADPPQASTDTPEARTPIPLELLNLDVFMFDAGGGTPNFPPLDDDAMTTLINQLRCLTLTPNRERVSFQVFRDIHHATPLWYAFDLANAADRNAASFVMRLDDRVSTCKPKLVPKEMSEQTFFFNYFSHVLQLRASFERSPPAPQPSEQYNTPSLASNSGDDSPTANAGPDTTEPVEKGQPRIPIHAVSRTEDLVLVGSTNPVKINACKEAFEECFPNRIFKFVGCKVPSGVSDQPLGDRETYTGAVNRVRNCFLSDEYASLVRNATFVCGLEGGVRTIMPRVANKRGSTSSTHSAATVTAPAPELDNPQVASHGLRFPPPPPNGPMECFAWMVVYCTSTETWGSARTGSFILPDKIASLVKQGVELGKADDIVFGRSNSKQQDGAVGLLSKGRIDRTKYYSHAVVLALIPFMNIDLYESSEKKL